MTWLFEGSEVENLPESCVGFVYLITNQTNGKKYIGKKNFYFTKTRTIKGKRKRSKVESDWQDYYGSNKELQADVELLGKENFKREILKLCKSKGEFGYYEAKYQFENNVLENDEYYNTWIMCRVHKKHLTFIKKQGNI